MPRINIYEHSETYSFQTKNKAYACVAFPIAAIWGPAYDSSSEDTNPDWIRFQAGYRGTTDFVNTFRGPNTALGVREKSYDYALKLLASGYDILVKRADGLGSNASKSFIFDLGSGVNATGGFTYSITDNPVTVLGMSVKAKEPGSFGNRLKVGLERISARDAGSDTESTNVTVAIKVYLAGEAQSDVDYVQINNNDVLVETNTITYMQKPYTTQENESILYAIDSITVDSEYIQELKLQGFSAAKCADSDKGDPIYRPWVISLGKTVDVTDTSITALQLIQTGIEGSGDETFGKLDISAKYPGSFGNQLKVRIKVSENSNGVKSGTIEVFNRNGYAGDDDKITRNDELLEVVPISFDIHSATDAKPYLTEAKFSNLGTIHLKHEDLLEPGIYVVSLAGGTDYASIGKGIPTDIPVDVQIMNMLRERFSSDDSTFVQYIRDQVGNSATTPSTAGAATTDRIVQIWNQQKVFQNTTAMISELTDPLIYDWDALFIGIADDQYIPVAWQELHPEIELTYEVTKTHIKMFEVAANSKCGAALVGTPFGMKRGIFNEVTGVKTGAVKFKDDLSTFLGNTLSTYGELVGPWCKATLPINGANSWITPEVAHLLLIINAGGIGGQNKWWMVPAGMLGTGIVHSPEYKVKKAYLDLIQNHDEGVCLNPLMQVPGKGFTCFGNSTLWDKPLGTYNALQNFSTRLLTNRVKQRIWDTALQILFKYNNENAYSHFYAGVSPLLDEMRAVGALTGTESNPWGYRIIMNPDIINLDRINANTVIGKVELAVTGVIDTVDVDLFLLPPTAFETNTD